MTEICKRWGLPYCRVSSKKQEEDGSGLESQEHRLRDHCRQKGYPVVRAFRDTITGGGDFMDRPAMRELLRFIDEHTLPSDERYVVVFDDLKRFARDVEFHWRLRNAFSSRSVEVECLNFNFDDTPEGRFVETVLAGAGQLERDQNRRQVLQKMQARIKAGYWAFPAPPGYRYAKTKAHGKLLVPDEPTASIVREAFEGFASGRFQTQVEVQRFLAHKGFAAHRTLTSVRRLLTRDLYTGYVEHQPWGISRRKGRHEPLVSLSVFERVQQRLEDRTPTLTRKDYRADFPLRRFVTCARCTWPLTASFSTGRGGRYPYYRCHRRGCSGYYANIPRARLEADFETLLKDITPKPAIVDYTYALAWEFWQGALQDVEGARRRLEDEHRACEDEIARLAVRAAKTASDAAAAAYEERIAKLARRQAVLTEKMKRGDTVETEFGTALEEVLGFVRSPYEIWSSGRFADRRALLRLAFDGSTPYDAETGFGTPNLSPGLALMKELQGADSQDVDLLKNSWNGVQSCMERDGAPPQNPQKKRRPIHQSRSRRVESLFNGLLNSRWHAFAQWVLLGHQTLQATLPKNT